MRPEPTWMNWMSQYKPKKFRALPISFVANVVFRMLWTLNVICLGIALFAALVDTVEELACVDAEY